MRTDDGRLYVLAGKSRSGKTAYVLREIQKKHFSRVIAWDPEDQWGRLPGWRRFESLSDLAWALNSGGRLAYTVDGDIETLKAEFDRFCRVAFKWGDIVGGVVVIAEELADVTSTAKAPGNWGALPRKGLKRGISIYAISQRWAEADKTALNNASEFICFSMLPADVDYMAKKTGIAVEYLAALKRYETAAAIICPYVRLDVDNGEIERGRLVFRK